MCGQAALDKLGAEEDQARRQHERYSQLMRQLETVRKHKLKEMHTMLNVGSAFFVNAKVPDTSRVLVDVGLGVHIEYSLDEAIGVCKQRVAVFSTYAREASPVSTAVPRAHTHWSLPCVVGACNAHGSGSSKCKQICSLCVARDSAASSVRSHRVQAQQSKALLGTQ